MANGYVGFVTRLTGSSFLIKESGDRDPQCFGDLAQAQNGDVPLATLDAANEGAVQSAGVGELCLRPFSFGPQFTDAVTDFTQKVLCFVLHT